MKNLYLFFFISFLMFSETAISQVGIGTVSPDASSILDVYSNSKGFLMPRLTTAERDAISSPAAGLLIYNTDTSHFNFYNLSWKDFVANSNGYSSIDASSPISTTSSTDEVVSGMTLTPGAGSYMVTFNSQYTIASGNQTAQGATDLNDAYDELMLTAATNTSHAAAFGGETLTAGVYTIGAAGSLAGNLTLDAQGDSNAVFIFRFTGAFNTGAAAEVILTNGASACNVFWVAQGAIGLGAGTIMKGTLLSHNAAVTVGAGSTVTGRLFTTSGAISVDSSSITEPTSCSYLDLGILSNFAMFTSSGNVSNTGASGITGNIGTNFGTITGFGTASVNGTIYNPVAINNALATFSIYQNGVLIANSIRTRTLNVNTVDISLQAIATVADGQAIDVRWKVDDGTITLANRILTLKK